MNELVKVKEECIAGEMVPAVDARELYKFLGVETRFNDWIKRRISSDFFKEGRDYKSLTQNRVSGGIQVNYYVALDFAKHICMKENTDKAHEIREYFIEVEKESRKLKNQRFKGNPLYELTIGFLEMQERQQQQEKTLLMHRIEIDETKQEMEQVKKIVAEEKMYTVREYLNIKGIPSDRKERQKVGTWARKFSLYLGHEMKKTIDREDDLEVNMYNVKAIRHAMKFLGYKNIFMDKEDEQIHERFKD